MTMLSRWYRTGAFYSVDVGLFQDSNDDGVGDFQGLMSRLDYLARLGVTTIWLNPIHPSPRRDGGYDITDHFGMDQRFGSLGDFAILLHEAGERGIRIMLDFVVNHTSDAHPWFQAARSDPQSPFRDWYVWSETEPPDRWKGMVFPGVENETWTYDEKAHAWYRHRFYRFEPDLNTDHPAVREEIRKIALFWLRLGVSGFRIDAAPFLIEPKTRASQQRAYEFLHELRETLSWHRGDALLLAEANVPDEELTEYFGQSDGAATRVLMVFAFRLNQAMMLALARQDARPVAATLRELPALPRHGQWATFLRNHDEVDLGRLSPEERREVFDAFGPDENMQLYERGIRRRLAPMLGGNRRRIELAYSCS
jgi:maltose alpha-D-glucosyltransferase/alpha-amylase